MDIQQQLQYASTVIPPVPAGLTQQGVSPRNPGSADFRRLLGQLEPIGLEQMDDVALLDRTDTKYLLKASQLYTALAALNAHYRVLDIDGVRLHPYQTLYFDTADFALYMRHHDGRELRYKVRSRQYVESQRSFLEVKTKTNKRRTNKQRVETSTLVTGFTPETSGFVHALLPVDPRSLEPKLWNSFSRVTLVSKYYQERLTLDLDLQFGNGLDVVALPGLAIAEVKQEGINRQSAFVRQMRAMALHETGFSKYCIGVAMLYKDIKHNNFKAKLGQVDKLIGADDHVYGTH